MDLSGGRVRGAEGDRMKGAIARTSGPAWKVDGDGRTLERRGDTGLNERPLLARELSCDTVEVESGEGESGPAVLQGSRRATAAVTAACLPGCGCHCSAPRAWLSLCLFFI